MLFITASGYQHVHLSPYEQLVEQVLSPETVMQEFVAGGGSIHIAALLSLPQAPTPSPLKLV